MKKGVFDLGKEIRFSKGGVYSKVLWKSRRASCTLLCVARGAGLDAHTSARDACLTVVSGRGVLSLGGKRVPLAPGVTVFMQANAKHALRASENLSFLLFLSQ